VRRLIDGAAKVETAIGCLAVAWIAIWASLVCVGGYCLFRVASWIVDGGLERTLGA
jgi:hypothetical protein